jgi:adenosylhomocysteine nucleosidase
MRSFFVLFIVLTIACQPENSKPKIVVLISANAEWRVVKAVYPNENYLTTPWGEYFVLDMTTVKGKEPIIFFHEGWGKVAAAGATQYAIDRWNPEVFINLGTCGGFEGSVNRFEILLVDRAIIYDIKEAMGDSKEAIQDYSTEIDLSWLNYPDTVKKTVLVSADRDLVPDEIESLKQNYKAIAGDWETGAIAYTCKRNNRKLLVLRGVTDLVSPAGGEAYGNPDVFVNGTEVVMKKLLGDLPQWLMAVTRD